jgi:hypothetical protein
LKRKYPAPVATEAAEGQYRVRFAAVLVLITVKPVIGAVDMEQLRKIAERAAEADGKDRSIG